ncbi:alpha/beta fold hydrolase [Candidatus Sodalis sp. SoCistrobi]|uniref:alpha/beta fold hydrolase n=1 Tax=Candidatus Sodalis sp. SoCistrobi TaxID=1922216 RepID=UPI000AEA9485|nr:alpha/beta fold hydrolase [Candidatus Sodalis sp. SoCistrobi]
MSVCEYMLPGMFIKEHLVKVPLDWSQPEDGRTLELFVREVVDPRKRHHALPKLAFLQGGPGGKGPRPQGGGPVWLAEALKTHRVILLDQRGTGRSSRVESATLATMDPHAGAAYLWHFRADSIVRDCEFLRTRLFGGDRWETLGQSYGGFLTLSYLSLAPEGLAACYVTGGLPGLDATADEVYRRTYPRVAAKNACYFRRYPADAARIARLADVIADRAVRLPDGDRLSVRRLQTLGMAFGMGPGFDQVHGLIEEAFSDSAETRLSDHFLMAIMAETGYDANPLYAVLQEVIYGQPGQAGNWAAERVRQAFPAFQSDARPLLFTGEMIYPWMFDEIRSLRPFRAAAAQLATRQDYPPLYDLTRLASNAVPVAAVIYHDDMYVDADLSLATAARVGNLQAWVTNEFEHDGLRQSASVFRRLRQMLDDNGGPLG